VNTSSQSPRRRASTLSDVARLAGVSVATASKALSGRHQVREQTRIRVIEAAAQLSFTPNPMARGLTAARSGTVGLITSDLEGRFGIPVLMGAEDAFGAGRMSVLLCDARGDALREQHHLTTLLSRRVDGLIVVGSRTDPRPSLGQDLPVPVVYAYAPSDDPRDVSLVPDNVEAGVMAAEHLLEIGRRHIAHISGDRGYVAATDRAEGAANALAAHGLRFAGEGPLFGEWSEYWGYAAMRSLLDRSVEVDAVMCGSDQVARGVLDALRERGRGVPEDVAVIGFDNWGPILAGARPPLSTVDMNLELLGRLAAQRLFDRIDGDAAHGVQRLPCRLVLRESTLGAG
jgi:LacI family transcriptional regulator